MDCETEKFGFDSHQRDKIFLFSITSRPTPLPPFSLFTGYRRPFPVFMFQGIETEISPSSSAEVKNGGAIPLVLHKWRGVYLLNQ
jgi:hypothetical protein